MNVLLVSFLTVVNCSPTSTTLTNGYGGEKGRAWIPSGSYTIGCVGEVICGENPRRTVVVKGFYIDRMPSRWRDAYFCRQDGKCHFDVYTNQTPKDEAIVATYGEALNLCRSRGGRLPTNEEWEVSARGADERLFPWGNDLEYRLLPDAEVRTIGDRQVVAIYIPRVITGSESPFGVMGLVGGLSEWVVPNSASTPIARGGTEATDVSGIGFHSPDRLAFSTVRVRHLSAAARVGVRCAFGDDG